MSISCIVVLTTLVIAINGQHVAPIVQIPDLGAVQGSLGETAWSKRPIYKFQAIPYAQPPLGPLRFRLPVKVTPWNGTIDASYPGSVCPQIDDGGNLIGNENCLTLSVYSNNLEASRPVMLFIHGGWYITGGAKDFQPEFMLEKDIVLVVVQYRLGPLGFLCTMTEDIPGNVGIFDMVAALEWVQQYIGNFGGDSYEVTAFGQSAGSRSISAMLHSRLIQSRPVPLFRRAILQSGTLYAAWAISDNPVHGSLDIARRAGCTDNSTLVHCLRESSVRSLLDAFAAHRKEAIASSGYPAAAGSALVVGGPSGLFAEHPKYLRKGTSGISIMAGVVNQDGLHALNDIYKAQPLQLTSNTSFGLLYLIRTLHEKLGQTRLDGALEDYGLNLNFLRSEIDHPQWNDIILGLADIAGIQGVKASLLVDIQPYLQANPGNVYLYSYDYSAPDVETLTAVPFPYRGAVQHADELNYLFPLKAMNAEDTRMAKLTVQLWTTFATSGVPSAEGLPRWTPMDGLYGPYLKINSKTEQADYFYKEFTATSRKYKAGFDTSGRQNGSIHTTYYL